MIVLDFETERALLQVVKNGRTARATVTVYERASRLSRFVDVLNVAEADKRARFAERLAAACGEEWRPEITERLADAAVEIAQREATGTNDRDQPQGRTLELQDPEPWPQPVNGAELLDGLAAWFRRLVWFPAPAADAAALWAASTYFAVYFAALLLLLSATKRCAKSRLLRLLRRVVRRGWFTSAKGVSSAVLFRLNEAQHPTFCIDEAEKLAGRDADRDLIGLLNAGHEQGATAARCSPDDHQVRVFDAFGFRALAAIGDLWDTFMDRAVVIRLERKPRGVAVQRLNSRRADEEGQDFAAQLRRWAQDHGPDVLDAEAEAPRPEWLDDRACDNWAALFAVAAVAGGGWPDRALAAARALQIGSEDEQDPRERLVHDLRRVFTDEHEPEVIQSGQLAEKLNALDDAPWSEYRGRKGLSAQGLARLLRPFRVAPDRRRRATDGEQVRGYWLADLLPVFERYPAAEAAPDDDVPF